MKIYYDFHIHSALSPCSDDDMTPNNIVNMSKIKELDVIAITDHNSCKNIEACMKVGNEIGLLVIPGMELQTKEEVHSVCLFKDLEKALDFQEIVYKKLPNLKNKPSLFGNQIIYNENDEEIGKEEIMLLSSCDITLDEAYKKVKELGGVVIPSHVDKDAYSIISNLGFIPDYLDIKAVEYINYDKINKYIKLGMIKPDLKLIKSSDAHNLAAISERENYLEVDELNIEFILNLFR